MAHALRIFAGNAGMEQGQLMCDILDMSLGKAEVKKFANQETSVRVQDSVRDCDVFVVQSGSSAHVSPNDRCRGGTLFFCFCFRRDATDPPCLCV